MAVSNPFSITYGTREVGGSSATYQLHGPYVLDKSHESLRVVFDVVVVGTSYSDLQTLSEDLEDDFSKRLVHNDEFVISLDGSDWTYVHGTTMLSAKATIQKSGNQETDKGFARAYTISVEAELPATTDAGLRDVEVLVDFEASRQRTVTMRGVYTATTAGHAVARYQADFDAEAQVYLDVILPPAADVAWELVDESYTYDRELNTTPNPHLCTFSRQYVQLLANQSRASLDDTDIKDHRVTFTDLSQHPGDSRETISRLRRVIGSYDCAVDIDETMDLQAAYTDKVAPHVKQLFQTNFEPVIFAVEDKRISYDETSKRMSVSIQFLYQKSGDGENVVEISHSVAFREARNIDYTPTHDSAEFAAHVDVGWATLERVWNRTVIVIGRETPKLRILSNPAKGGDAGPFDDEIGGQKGPDQGGRRLVREGWNVVANTSQVTPKWVGDPAGGSEQIELTVLTESVTERYNIEPGNRTFVPIQKTISPKK